MRIISGKYKGRKIDDYNVVGTRPTMDRVKESFIAMIQEKIENSVCLDLFAGSGSVGLEFLSNGAKKCYFVDSNIKITEILKQNITKFKITEDLEIIKSDYIEALRRFAENKIKFDIIFLDPPYKLNYIMPALTLIKKLNLLNDNGYIICEYEEELLDIDFYNLIKEKKYGNKNIKIYKN